jgi:hypothetical protein
MVSLEQSSAARYVALPPRFHELYVDSSYSATPAQPIQNSAWEVLNRYVPLIGTSYRPGEPDPLEQLVSHRSAVLKAQVESLVAQLYDRGKIHEQTLKSIETDTLRIDEGLLQLEQMMRTCRINPPPELSKKEQNLEGELLNLERQRRDEYTAFWKDQVLLRKDLVELAGAHVAAKARENILDGVNGYGI